MDLFPESIFFFFLTNQNAVKQSSNKLKLPEIKQGTTPENLAQTHTLTQYT